MAILYAHLLLKFCVDSFKTSLMFWSWSEDKHVICFLLLVSQVALMLLVSKVEFSRFIGIFTINVTRSDTGYIVCTTPTNLC